MRSPPSSSVYKSLLHNNIPVIRITFPFLELTRASPSHLSKLINLGLLFNIKKNSSIKKLFAHQAYFQGGAPNLSCLTFMLGTGNKFLGQNSASRQKNFRTLIFAFDQESAFFSVQCQLLTLVASGLSSTIHLN